MKTDFDIAVVGSGFGGSLTAMIARRLGRSVILVERGRHPRFAIGESSTPLANLLLEELALRYDLPRLLPLAKWGSWQKTYPQTACGLKRGFTFYQHEFEKPFLNDSERRNQLLVAASPRDEIADTQWYRADFDHFLVREAQALGVVYLDQTKLETAALNSTSAALEGERGGKRVSVRARFMVEARGPRAFLPLALRFAEGEAACNRRLERLPSLRELFTDATSQWPFVHAPRLSFRSATVVGPRWALLPSAAGVVDPLLSTGFPLTLQGIARLAVVLEADLDSPRLEE